MWKTLLRKIGLIAVEAAVEEVAKKKPRRTSAEVDADAVKELAELRALPALTRNQALRVAKLEKRLANKA